MATRRSAGLLLYRTGPDLQVLIGHMGGPLWARRDEAAWSIPKGEYEGDEPALAAAEREFQEETGQPPPGGDRIDLGEVRQAGGKLVRVWAVRGDVDATACASGAFETEWPPRSGRYVSFPELDRFAWCTPDEARLRLVVAQRAFVDRLQAALSV